MSNCILQPHLDFRVHNLMLGEAEINRDVLATVQRYMVSERSSLYFQCCTSQTERYYKPVDIAYYKISTDLVASRCD